MWNVPAKAARGSTRSSRSRGSRDRSMLTLSCAPSGAGSVSTGPAPARASSWLRTAGASPDSTVDPCAVRSPSPCWRQVTSPSGSTETTSAPVSTVAPAATAARASPSVTAPMPPTGTSQSPVPPPMRW